MQERKLHALKLKLNTVGRSLSKHKASIGQRLTKICRQPHQLGYLNF